MPQASQSSKLACLSIMAFTLGAGSSSALAQLAIVSTNPPLNKTNVDRSAAISVTFDKPVDASTFTAKNFHAFAIWSGSVAGSLAFSPDNKTVTLTPSKPFVAGEFVRLFMSHNLKATDGTTLRQAGYTLMFSTVAVASSGDFCHRQTFSSKDASGKFTRIYGGLACDLDRDGALDLTLVNENTADLRVYLNANDGSGTMGSLLEPPAKIPFESSPNEPADFNGDGFIDVVTSSNATNEIAIAMGNGDGTYDPPTLIKVGTYPRGFGILDADGDGDMDITVTNNQSNSIAKLFNDGNGNFSAPQFMNTTGENGPYGMASADMNSDGILDLVVGFNQSDTCVVYRGNGDGTFTKVSSRDIGGANWVLALGDVNNDGHIDVSSANSGSSNGSILLGNGDGTLKAASVQPNGGHTTGTDLADFDGDGDLDWIISSYGASKWYIYKNNGQGVFTFDQDFDADGNPACAVPADFDGDGRMDVALLDEIEDLVQMWGGSPLPSDCYANCDCSASLTIDDFICFQTRFALGDDYADCDQDSALSIDDFICYQTLFAVGC